VARFPDRVVLGPTAKQDEYGHKAHAQLAEIAEPKAVKTSLEAFEVLRPRCARPPLRPLAGVQTLDGKPAWGVEYLAVRHDGRILVNLCNYLRQTQKCHILRDGKPVAGKDLISGKPFPAHLELPSLKPMLIEVSARNQEFR
jgi:hypothetical protein